MDSRPEEGNQVVGAGPFAPEESPDSHNRSRHQGERMNRFMNRAVGTVAAVSLGFLGMQAVRAQQDLPKAEDVLDKYVTATGGKEVYEKIKSRVSTGTMEIAGLGVKGKLVMYQAAPNKMYMEIELPGVGKVEQGTDGQTVWEKSTVGGPRVKQGDEKATFLRSATLDAEVNWRKQYPKVECKAEEKIDGKPCYKVELTTPEGQVRTGYYDKATGLLVKIMSKEKTQFGEVPAESTVSDYKKVDGLLIPHKVRQKALTQEVIITLDKVEHNVKLHADRFNLPEDIKKLVEKEKKPAK